MSTMIVGLMTVASLHTLGAATRSSLSTGQRAMALGLADDFMAEILAVAYENLDDYDDWDETLTDDDGEPTGWTRSATVERVLPGNVMQTTAGNADQGAKRIRVAIEHEGREMITQQAIRTNAE